MDNTPQNQQGSTDLPSAVDKPVCDEDAHLMIYGNIKIRDIDTDDILVNQRF